MSAIDCFIWINAEIFYMCVECIKLPDLRMAAECPASILPVVHFESAVGWVRWGWLRALPSVILLFKNNSIFTSRYWIFINTFFHTSQGIKILIEIFALFHRILQFPQNKNFSKTNGSDVEYEIQFCHQCFSVEGKKTDCLFSWTLETNHLTQLVVRGFLISLQIVYLLLYFSCQWLHSFYFILCKSTNYCSIF